MCDAISGRCTLKPPTPKIEVAVQKLGYSSEFLRMMEGRAFDEGLDIGHGVQGPLGNHDHRDLLLFGFLQHIGYRLGVFGQDQAAGRAVQGAPLEVRPITPGDEGLVLLALATVFT